VLLAALLGADLLASGSLPPAPEGGERRSLDRGDLDEAQRLLDVGAFEPARQLLEETLADARTDGDRSREAECLRLLGVVMFGAGDGESGTSYIRAALRVARALEDRRLEAAILVDWASGHWRRAEYAASLTLLDEALAIQFEEGDLEGQAASLVVMGRVYFKEGAYEQALEHHRRALLIQEGLGDLHAQAVTLEDMGDVYNDRHEYAAALELFGRSLRLRETIGDLSGQASIHLVIGTCYLIQGATLEAGRHFQDSFDIATRLGDPASQAAALYHLAGADRRRGRCERANAGYRRALALHEDLGDRRAAAWDHAMIGNCCGQLGDLDESAAHQELARSIRTEIGDLRNLADSLEALADVRLAQGRLVEAERLYLEAAALSDQIQLPYLCLTEGKLAVALAREGRGHEALRLAERAVSDSLLLENRSLQWESHYRLGLVQMELGRLEAAVASLAAALDAIDDLRAGLGGGDEPRVGFMEDKQQVYADAVEVLLRLGRTAEALEVAERSRARALVDMLRREADLESDHKGLRGDDLGGDRWLERLLGSVSRSGSTAPGAIATVPAARSSSRQRVPGPERLEGLVRQTRIRNATILEYLVSDQRLYVWAVEPDGSVTAAAVAVSRERLAGLVADARRFSTGEMGKVPGGPTETPGGEGAVAALRELHRLLIEPVAARLPGDPSQLVVLVPHGPLHALSFASLCSADGRYLVEGHALASAPSISVLGLLEVSARRWTIEGASLLLVANPVPPPELAGGLPALPGTEREVEAIARLFPKSQVELLRGEGAWEDRVRALAPRFGILHLATHGVVRDDDPFESWLLLAGAAPAPGVSATASGASAAGAGSDGRWTAREIAVEQLNAGLVVLSACNTGLGKVTGDGVVGLSRAFLVAGASSLVASLWRVSDVVASFQMEAFYRALRAGDRGPAAALREAQLATRRALREGRLRAEDGRALPDHPALWAPFVVIGEGSAW
jgi:CHAT domain-containing protein/tetratricopeptide (TPR) repeat protein